MVQSTSVQRLVDSFVARLTAVVQSSAEARAREAVLRALGGKATTPRVSVRPAAPAKRSPKLSAAGLKARKLQGQYLGALRTITGEARARVRKLAKEKGVAEALKFAQSLKRGSK
jgi:hypothetical protein